MLLSALLILTASSALAAPQVYALDNTGMPHTALQTESSWMAVEVPLTELGGADLVDVSIEVSGLPAGTSIVLTDVTTRGESALLHVTVSRTDPTVPVNGVAVISVSWRGDLLTRVAIPVVGIAVN